MTRPTTNRSVADEIARAYEKFDRQELIDICSYLTKVYVVDGTMPFNLPVQGSGQLGDVDGAEKDFTFVKLIDQLKRRLPRLTELSHFQIEEGRVTLRAGNQKITFAEDRVTSEFVPASAPSAPSSKAAAPAVAAAAKAGSGGGAKKPEEKEKNLSEAQQEALNDIVTRFKNLELD